MFSGPEGARNGCPPALDIAEEATAPLVAAVLAAVEARPETGLPVAAALAVWGQVHGLVSLELSGLQPPDGSWYGIYEAALAGIARAYLDG